jgi:glycosyltransferase involved in cell wall biosynthesis
MLKKLSVEDKRVKYVSFSRNFGKEAAMLAGLEHSRGDYIAIMDADLQDPPELLESMYKDITKGDYDCIGLRRVSRKGEPKLRSFFAKNYYKIINKISKVNIVDGARDFRLMTRQMVNSILELKENNRYSKGLFSWVGYNTKWLEYKNVERVAGNTKWSFFKLFVYSIESIVSFSNAPLMISIFLSILFGIAAFIMTIIIIVQAIMGVLISNLLVISAIITFISSVQLFIIGILGIYLSKVHLETKKRPIYLVKETNIK